LPPSLLALLLSNADLAQFALAEATAARMRGLAQEMPAAYPPGDAGREWRELVTTRAWQVLLPRQASLQGLIGCPRSLRPAHAMCFPCITV